MGGEVMDVVQQLDWIIADREIKLKDTPKNRLLNGTIDGLTIAKDVIEDGCEWQWNFLTDVWETECEQTNENPPVNFCQFCGRKVRLSKFS